MTKLTMLAVLMVSFVPLVLAQQDSGEEPPFELFLGGPDGDDLFTSGGQAIGCGSVFGVPSDDPLDEVSSPVQTSPEVGEEARRLCLENGYVPPNVGTSTGIRYENIGDGPPEIARCLERSPGGFCSAYIGTNGSINQAIPAY